MLIPAPLEVSERLLEDGDVVAAALQRDGRRQTRYARADDEEPLCAIRRT